MIKRKFSALIPAFDPRPGRTNVNQTSDLDITLPPINSEATREVSPSTERPTPEREMPRLQLILRGPNIPGIPGIIAPPFDFTNFCYYYYFQIYNL